MYEDRSYDPSSYLTDQRKRDSSVDIWGEQENDIYAKYDEEFDELNNSGHYKEARDDEIHYQNNSRLQPAISALSSDSHGLKTSDVHSRNNRRLQPTISALSSESHGLKTSDQAFEITAKLVVDHLSPKVAINATSYYLDSTDIIFLDAVVPEAIRNDFVEAVAYRSESNQSSSDLAFLVAECMRLGLGHRDSFLLGGGQMLDDGRLLVKTVSKSKQNKTQQRRQPGSNSVVPSLAEAIGDKLNTSDEAFEVTAKLLVSYLCLKLEPGATSYYLDSSDILFIDAIVPNDIRHAFVQSVAFRAKSLPDSIKDLSSFDTLVRECVRLGLGRSDCFLLTGGVKMDDGRIMVVTDGVKQNEDSSNIVTGFLRRIGLTHDPVEESVENPNMKEKKLGIHEDNKRKQSVSESRGRQKGRALPKSQMSTRLIDSNKSSLLPKSTINTMLPPVTTPGDSTSHKGVIGSPPPSTDIKSERAMRRRMRSIERRSKMRMYEEEVEEPLQSTWRNGLWDYSVHGLLHKFLVLSFVAPLFALGQVQTREKLNWLGLPAASTRDVSSVFTKLRLVAIGHTLSNLLLLSTIYWNWSHDILSSLCIFLLVMVNLLNRAFLVIICGNTRCSIRRSNNIPQMFELEDFLLPLLFLRFVVAQLGRHTVDYNKVEAVVLSTDGINYYKDDCMDKGSYVNPKIEMMNKNSGLSLV